MDISIRRTDFDLPLNENRLLWKLMMRKTTFYIVLYFFLGILFASTIFFQPAEEKPIGLTSTLGVAFILLALIYLIQVFTAKKKFFSVVKKHIENSKKAGTENEVSINENKVITQNFECRQELKWSAFTSFMLYKDHLFLMRETTVLMSIIVNRNELQKEQFLELIDFVRKRLPEKKSSIF